MPDKSDKPLSPASATRTGMTPTRFRRLPVFARDYIITLEKANSASDWRAFTLTEAAEEVLRCVDWKRLSEPTDDALILALAVLRKVVE